MQREYEYYLSALGREVVEELHRKLKLAIARMAKWNWYAASIESSGGPDTKEMHTVAFLFAAHEMEEGEADVHKAMQVGLREAVKLAQHDAAAYLYHGPDYKDNGDIQSRTILSDLSFDTLDPVWTDGDGTSYYNQVENDIDRDILRLKVSETLTGPERDVVLLFIDDLDSDEYGWKARTAKSLGWSREVFNQRLARGFKTLEQELYGRKTTT